MTDVRWGGTVIHLRLVDTVWRLLPLLLFLQCRFQLSHRCRDRQQQTSGIPNQRSARARSICLSLGTDQTRVSTRHGRWVNCVQVRAQLHTNSKSGRCNGWLPHGDRILLHAMRNWMQFNTRCAPSSPVRQSPSTTKSTAACIKTRSPFQPCPCNNSSATAPLAMRQ